MLKNKQIICPNSYEGGDILCIKNQTFWPLKNHPECLHCRYLALLGIGSNIPPESVRFRWLANRLLNDARIQLLATSALVINKPFGYLNQRNFTNAVALISTNLTPTQLLGWAQHIENLGGRKRSFKNAPRTLDIDILYHSFRHRQSKKLLLPHPGFFERLSVQVPLGLMLSELKI